MSATDSFPNSWDYEDLYWEYRIISLPGLELTRLLTEAEWRELGVHLSRGWMHFVIDAADPHIFFFRRPIRTNRITGRAPIGRVPPGGNEENETERTVCSETKGCPANFELNVDGIGHEEEYVFYGIQ